MANQPDSILSPVPEFSTLGLEQGDLDKQLPEFDERDYSSTLPTKSNSWPFGFNVS